MTAATDGGASDAAADGAAGVIAAAQAWRAQDPDAETRAELDALIEDAQTAGAQPGDSEALRELHSRFDTRLQFGTAGLRGELAAGPNRMNRVLVAQAAAGLAAFLIGRQAHPSVVIGYDGRKNSRVFATDSAEILAGAGVRAILLPRLLPTPVLAFAVRHLGASAGVMVTASHNPPRDNGYKVYLGGDDEGSQIVPPVDAEIAAHILQVADSISVPDLPRGDYEIVGEQLLDDYVTRTARFGTHPAPLRFIYTAMHGVGWETAQRVFAAAGVAGAIPVPEQIEPDAAFPTVAFPNPEEPGALDLAIATAQREGAELIVANDPDADRLAIAVPDASATGTGAWRRLSGNEVGYLLGWRAAERMRREGRRGTLATSIVSSPALAEIARQYGSDHVETLTGFKWVSRVPNLAYGYEEALGYLVDPDTVRDKDGISAALDFLALAAELKADGSNLPEHALAFAARFGAFASAQVSLRVTDTADIATIMRRLRADPPQRIAGMVIDSVDDFAAGLGDFAPSDILRFTLAGSARIIVRPSGTEPKLKVYIDASSSTGAAAERITTAQQCVDRLEAAIHPLLAELRTPQL
ncbi:phospho-sugar mutase [Parafrigoribacterium mesophilum]|uniref:phospho-sugar mutase n=1 Tax=Parafrigoribacterium mesophilum TaxID=433646 RepID=UPI0031FCDC3E